jgi:hypothetical protein
MTDFQELFRLLSLKNRLATILPLRFHAIFTCLDAPHLDLCDAASYLTAVSEKKRPGCNEIVDRLSRLV